MDDLIDSGFEQRLDGLLDRIGVILNNKCRRASFATYAMGLLAEGERKSMEPIAARACADPDGTDALHQRLQHFLNDAAWDDHAVRRIAADHALAAMTMRGPVVVSIVDDTGFLKKGDHSVGVQRQYTGSAGKITNCQIGVSLSVATAHDHMPIDFELYLPASWTGDAVRRKEARIPDEVVFRTKHALALAMIGRAREAGRPLGVMLADAAYGTSSAFRLQLSAWGIEYAVAVDATSKVWRVDAQGQRRGESISVRDLAMTMGEQRFRNTTWREGSRRALRSRFAMLRVVPMHDDGVDAAWRERVTLVSEWPEGEAQPTKFFFATLPTQWSRKRLVRMIKERWRTERVYEDLKGELGFDHFEGRRYPGWHHHVSVALCCYALVVGERARRFPPAARGSRRARAHSLAA